MKTPEGQVSSRERRRRRREDLRSKSTGVGLQISEDSSKQNKKIVFGDDDDIETTSANQEVKEVAVQVIHEQGADSNDSDDDAVEEVKGSVAKELVKEQRTQERTIARESTDLKTSKRKRKSRPDKKEEEEEDLDDDFFTELDADLEENRKKNKSGDNAPLPKGRHTTFVATDEAFEDCAPVRAGDNIEVVVLKDQSALEGTSSAPVSKTALFFSRNHLVDGADLISEKQERKAKKSGRNVAEVTATWKRSKKMNRLIVPGGKAKRRNGQGVAASHFVIKM